MQRRRVAVLVCAVLPAIAFGAQNAWAHAGLRLSDPIAGATLGASPTVVRLTFTELPEPSLSSIRVLDAHGGEVEAGRALRVPGDSLSLDVHVRPLPRGVYTVSWRVFSAVDGHATSGAYAFGVRESPTGAAAAAPTATPSSSSFELLARWILIVGLVVLLGAAAAGVARFGGGNEVKLGAVGWLLAVAGLLLLAEAQRRNAATSFSDLLETPIGRALVWRALPLGAAGGALLLAARARSRARWVAMAAVALAALTAMAAHVTAGHAAAGGSNSLRVAEQWAHFAAVGIWLGGLAALLLGVRGAPSGAKAASVRRFSTIAGAGLVVVVATGTLQAINELSSWGELVSTGYGRAVLAKIALISGIAAFGAFNRWRSVPAAATNLHPLRRNGTGELVLAAGALVAAAFLGTLAPPAAGRLIAPAGLSVAGADFATTVRVKLTTASPEPGPNRFVVRAVDYDSNAPVKATRVTLRFTPLDDPGLASSTLRLERSGDSYVGTGDNLAFDGRWGVTVLIERAADAVQVPLELDARGPAQFVSIERIPGGQAPKFTVQVGNVGYVRVTPDPERAGRSKLYVTVFDAFSDERAAAQIVVTAAAGDGPTRQLSVRRLSKGRFVSDADLSVGHDTIAVVARTADGTRLRAVVGLDIPHR